jgi:hypothetical protein
MKPVVAAAVAVAGALAGCYLPIATGTPEPATTVGTGRFGVRFRRTDARSHRRHLGLQRQPAGAAAAGKIGAYGVAGTASRPRFETSLASTSCRCRSADRSGSASR